MDFIDIPTIEKSQFVVSNFLTGESKNKTIAEIFKGLTAKQKNISSRFFYDDIGSMLFEEITELPEYYTTRSEKAILKAIAPKVIGHTEQLDIIELGSGDCSKISILLDVVSKNKLRQFHYIPVDVSEAAVLKSADLLTYKYPGIKIYGLLADFMKHLDSLPGNNPRLICFFGSTLGNLTRKQSIDFLKNMKSLMKPGDRFILGLDMVKDREILRNAYNDKQGITARFNKNILNVINDVAKTNFTTTNFEHLAFYNEVEARIEMHLLAIKDMVITSDLFPENIYIKQGETIHTENSHKFTTSDIQDIASVTNLKIEAIYTDKNQWFSLVNFTKPTTDG